MIKPKGLSLVFLIFCLSLLVLEGCSPQVTSGAPLDPGSIILARAKIWVDIPVPYGGLNSWHGNPIYHQGYKTDCSGFVSYAWELPKPGTDTVNIKTYARYISIPDLQPGDALNNEKLGDAGHIVLFVRWLDIVNHTFDSYDLNTSPGYADEKTYTLVQIPNTNDWTISELEPYAHGPYQAQQLEFTTSAVLGPGPGPASSPMSSTIVPGYVQSIGSWTLSSSMITARESEGLALLNNGKVLITGGINNVPLASSEIYDPMVGTWSDTGMLNTGRFWFGNIVTLDNGQVLIAGGTDITGYNDYYSTELYNPDQGTWSYTGNLNTSRRNPTLTVLADGRVLIAGGRHGLPDGSSFLASAEIYDPATGQWSYTGSLNIARDSPKSVRLHDGRILLVGGEGPWREEGPTAELFDPQSGKWTLTGSMSIGWVEATLTVLQDGKVLRAGGRGSGYTLASAELYDPATGLWIMTGSMNVARAGHTATLLPDGRVLVAGGKDSSGALASSEIYDPVTRTWSMDANLQTARGDQGAVLLSNGKVLVVGGWSVDPSTGALASSELYSSTSP